MADILVYVLHYEGAFNKNSLGAVSEGARLAGELGGEAHAVVVGGDDLTDELCGSLGAHGATKVFRGQGPEGLAQPVVDVMAKVISDNGHAYALFGGGLLGFEIGAGLAARMIAGVTMEVTEVKVDDGKLVASRPILQDSKVSESRYKGDLGVITIPVSAAGEDQMMNDVLDSGAENMETSGDNYFITAAIADFENVKKALSKKYKFVSSEITMLPKDYVKVDEETGRKILNLMEALDDSEDVQKIYTNFMLPETLIGK